MIPIKFQAKKIKIGNSYAVIIPMSIAKLLDDVEYEYKIEKIQS